MVDVSRGHERLPIPVYNGADDDPAPNDFTYVTECVASEGLRLLLGGPLRDPWLCPYLESGGEALKKEERAYDHAGGSALGKFLHPPHTIHSIYECSLASGCGLNCSNRMVPRGPSYRLEVIRCMEREKKFPKGWGVRSPDFVPRGSFLCEYIGEYISDDEAERCAIITRAIGRHCRARASTPSAATAARASTARAHGAHTSLALAGCHVRSQPRHPI